MPTSADFFEQSCYIPSGISQLLDTAGLWIDSQLMQDKKVSTFTFAHPTTLDARLQAITTTYSDFKPPRFEACEGRYTFDQLAAYMGRGVMPLATHGYATVHDYEVHVPALTTMAPELFEALCEQSQTIQPSERSEWMKQIDTLTQLGAFGSLLASTSKADYRETMISWLDKHTQFSTVDAIRLAYHSENYRREVITPVVQNLSR